jgi:hypothetical protein
VSTDIKKTLRVSRPASDDIDGGGVNDQCHSNQIDVRPRDRHIMPHARVKVILWGHFFVDHPDAAATATDLVTAIVTGRYMNNLVQYGIGRGSFVDVSVVDTDSGAPAPHELSQGDAQDQLIAWLRASFITPKPSVNERNLLYLIFPPPSTTLTPADVGFGGYHTSGQFHSNSDHDDLFWAIFRTGPGAAKQTSGDALIRSISAVVSHEMTEAFSDRDNDGFITDSGCEVSDLCETMSSFSYEGFNVEQYWSNWNHACIRGDKAVSLTRFLKAAAHGVAHPAGLRWLHMPRIGLEDIAARMRS